MNYSPKKMSQMLNEKNFKFKKKYGQNFIIDENIINKIVENSNIDKNTLVIEIGPGAGSLTKKLAQNAKQVLCYEIDETLKIVLNDLVMEFNNIDIFYQDFLKSNILDDLKQYQ